MIALDLDAIQARYSAALAAKPGKGDYTEHGIAALEDSVCDVPTLVARLTDLTAERDAALAAIERVRAIHVPDEHPGHCRECYDDHPCPTIHALDGAES